MCVQEGEQVDQDNNMEELDNRIISWPLHCDLLHSQMDNTEKDSSFRITAVNSFPVSILLLHLLFLLFLHVM
jgi:protein phosphatase 2C family protein 2/3